MDCVQTKERKNSDTSLQCHFNWGLDLEKGTKGVREFAEKLKRELDEKPFMKVQLYTLLGYVLYLDDDHDQKKVTECFEKALAEAGDEEDKRFVAEANLVMTKYESLPGCDDRKKKLLEKWHQWEKNDVQKTAFTHGCYALALAKFSPNNNAQALRLYEIAQKRDPNEWLWYFGKAILNERIRILTNRYERPSEETQDIFKKALRHSQDCIYVKAHYISCLIARYHSEFIHHNRSSNNCEKSDEQEKLKQEIRALLESACSEAIDKRNTSVLKRCMKGFKDMKWMGRLKEWFEKIDKSPLKDDSGLQHRLARYHMESSKDYGKAKKCLQMSLESSAPRGNLFAAIDLIKAKFFLKEKIDIDSEYQTLMKKYGNVTKNVADIHQNWATSLEVKQDLRQKDEGIEVGPYKKTFTRDQKTNESIVFHYKEAIKKFNPQRVAGEKSWYMLKSLCQEVIKSPKPHYGMTREQAYRNLGLLHFLPEPKTEDNLAKAEKHLSCLKPDEFEQDDIERYGEVLYKLKQYDRALEQFEKLEDSHEKKTYHLAKCFLCLGMQKVDEQDQLKNAVEFLLKSVQNGCLDGCDMLLDNMAEIPPKDHYHLCGYITLCLEDSHSFFIGKSKDRELIERKMKKDILGITDIPKLENYKGLEGITKRIRHLQLVLNTDKLREFETDLLQTTKDLLAESRKLLDHLHHQLKQKLCPSSSGLVYFPHLSEGQISKTSNSPKPGSPEAKELTRKKIEEKFNSDLRDKVKVDKCRDLIEFVASHQPYFDPDSYSWLYDAWEVVKMEKHQEYLVSIETKVPRRDETVNYVELAQQLAFYSEGMLEQYCKILLQE